MNCFKTINTKFVPIKAHFLFFFAALGPMLPQLSVYGRQLGISSTVNGLITAVLPVLWALAKPAVGFLVDYFHHHRKFIFMCLIFCMSGSYFCMIFLPEASHGSYELSGNLTTLKDFREPIDSGIYIRRIPPRCDDEINNAEMCFNDSNFVIASCGWICTNKFVYFNDTAVNDTNKYEFWLSSSDITTNKHISSLYLNTSDRTLFSCDSFNMYAYVNEDNNNSSNDRIESKQNTYEKGFTIRCKFKDSCKFLSCAFADNQTQDIDTDINERGRNIVVTDIEFDLYKSITFWGFVIFMSAGTVAFNVANCISDAICFDVLGSEHVMKYGFQRAFGTAGYGITALLSGWLVDFVSGDQIKKNFMPAFVIMGILTIIDLYFCTKLELPKMSRAEDATGTLGKLFKEKTIVMFLIFAVIAGIFDSFIIYYMFWFLEELAEESGSFSNIKFIEGLIIAVQSFGGEIIFFTVSGKILKKLGFYYTFTLSLLFYAARLLFISMIAQPWHLVVLEMIFQGPTYALCYATIVGYAAAVAPPGLSATLQGIMGGMDDGVGFAIGSLIGGILYSIIGGRLSFRLLAIVAFLATIVHAILVSTTFKDIQLIKHNIFKNIDANNDEDKKLMKDISNTKQNEKLELREMVERDVLHKHKSDDLESAKE